MFIFMILWTFCSIWVWATQQYIIAVISNDVLSYIFAKKNHSLTQSLMVTLYFIYMDNECVLIEFEQNETNNTETLYKMYIAYSILIKLV